MIKIAGTIYNFYQGGYSSLDPNKSYGSIFTGYSVPAGELGAPTKADTANQIQQVNLLLNQGIVPIEVGALDPRVFDQIPKQHFKEINRMMQLTGGKVSVHAPIVEPTGITDQGWNETNRELAEKQLFEVVERTRELDPSGAMPITIHSTGLPGVEYAMTADGKKIQKIAVVNRENGKISGVDEELRYYPHLKDLKRETKPEEQIELINGSEWDNSVSQVLFHIDNADKLIDQTYGAVKDILPAYYFDEKFRASLSPEQQDIFTKIQTADEYLKHADLTLHSLFSKAYKYGTKEDQDNLKKVSEKYREMLGLNFDGKKFENLSEKEQQETIMQGRDPKNRLRAIHYLTTELSKTTPEMYVPVEKFALEKASETFSNVALKSYEKYGQEAPILSIENMFAGMAFGLKPDDKEGKGIPGMNELILETKHRFIDNAIKSKDQGGLGISKSEAEKQADRMIGMTLDVGHLNIAKKLGYKDEDLAKEVAAIAKHVKHVHLTDNFGYSDSHLPPGMGNVPFKKILEELEKAGTLGKVRKVVEAPGWPQHFGSSPLLYTLAGMGSEISSDGGPRWNQTETLYQGYFGGMGLMLPQVNYQTFGAGFSKLPTELGGQMPGAQGSRLSGNSME